MVAVKRIGLEGLKEEEIAQLMHEVELVKRLSHPSIVKYEGMARDENTLSIVLECVVLPTPLLCCAVLLPLVAAHLVILSMLTTWHHHVQVCRERVPWADSQSIREAQREAGGKLRRQDSRGPRLSPL
jgi:hypothetical protein